MSGLKTGLIKEQVFVAKFHSFLTKENSYKIERQRKTHSNGA